MSSSNPRALRFTSNRLFSISQNFRTHYLSTSVLFKPKNEERFAWGFDKPTPKVVEICTVSTVCGSIRIKTRKSHLLKMTTLSSSPRMKHRIQGLMSNHRVRRDTCVYLHSPCSGLCETLRNYKMERL